MMLLSSSSSFLAFLGAHEMTAFFCIAYCSGKLLIRHTVSNLIIIIIIIIILIIMTIIAAVVAVVVDDKT